MNSNAKPDPDAAKGAVEPSRPEDDAEGNVASFNKQLDHRFQDSLNKSSDSGLPGSGQTGEFSMEEQGENKLQQDTGEAVGPGDTEADADVKAEKRSRRPVE